MENKITINASTIPDAWFQCLYSLSEHGIKWFIQKGSNEGQYRIEFPWITIEVTNAYQVTSSGSYDAMLPEIPIELGIPNPVALGYVEQYIPYLLTSQKEENEDYTYGSRIEWQIEHIIKVLKETPNTNQMLLQIASSEMSLQVAEPNDIFLNDPPCLRHIDLRVRDNKLIMYPYFRSWDLWGGFPANLAAIAVLQKYMADEIRVELGSIIATSKGLHIYGYAEELMNIRLHLDKKGK